MNDYFEEGKFKRIVNLCKMFRFIVSEVNVR